MTGAIWITFWFAVISTVLATICLNVSGRADRAAGKEPEIGNRLEAAEAEGLWMAALGYTLVLWVTFTALVVIREVFF